MILDFRPMSDMLLFYKSNYKIIRYSFLVQKEEKYTYLCNVKHVIFIFGNLCF